MSEIKKRAAEYVDISLRDAEYYVEQARKNAKTVGDPQLTEKVERAAAPLKEAQEYITKRLDK